MTQLLKKVTNADIGTADIVGGDDWDKLSDYFNNVDLTPGSVTVNTSTLFKSGKLSTETISIPRGNITTVGGALTPTLEVSNTITTTDASPQNYPTANFISQYSAANSSSHFSVGTNGLQVELRYGVSPSDRAVGSALARTTTVKINGSGGTTPRNNEIAADMGWIKAIAGEVASIWYSDWNVHGPVAAQPGFLSGINMFVNNYYNGSPSRGGSYAIGVQTCPNNGAGNNAEHSAVSTYKLDYGIAIAGFAGTQGAPIRGYEVGLMIGGFDTNWLKSLATASKIGTGIRLTDVESVGIDLNDPGTGASSPIGISVTTVTRTWDTFIDLSGGLAPTTAAIKIADRPIVGSTEKIWNSGANTVDITATANTLSLLRIAPNISTVSTTAQRGILRILNNTGANSEYLSLEAIGTSGFIIDANKSGSGTIRDYNLQSAGVSVLSITATPIIISLKPHRFDDYHDVKAITIPADPAAGYGRIYAKTVNSNNDGLFVKLKKSGTVMEVQIA